MNVYYIQDLVKRVHTVLMQPVITRLILATAGSPALEGEGETRGIQKVAICNCTAWCQNLHTGVLGSDHWTGSGLKVTGC